MNIKKIGIILVLVLLMSVSCSDANKNPASVSDDVTDPANINITNTETDFEIKSNLPDIKFEGEVYNALTWDPTDTIVQNDIYAAEINGEPLNDAVFRRNSNIEERYEITINSIIAPRAGFVDKAKTAIMASEDLYDMINGSLSDANILAQSNYLVDLYTVPYIDLDQLWWDQRCNADLSIGGKLYMTMGDINTMDNSQTWGYIFNKNLAANFDITNLYDLVRQGNWTMDEMHSMCKIAAYDMNGDNVMDNNDCWGLFTESYNFYVNYLGTGELVSKKDNDDYPYLTMDSERSINVLEKIYTFMSDEETIFVAHKWAHVTSGSVFTEVIIPMFANDQGLFYFTGIGNSFKHLRDMKSDFGIIPTPKYDDTQDSYYNGVSIGWTTCIVIPVTNNKLEMTGVITEALAVESVSTVTEAYYDVVFLNKAVRDEESIEMVDLILQTRIFDLGYINNWGGIQSTFNSFATTTNMNFASVYESKASAIQSAMEDTVELYKD